MTSLAFVLGVLRSWSRAGQARPRAVDGNGRGRRHARRTFVATVFVPLFFTVFARRQKLGEAPSAVEPPSPAEPEDNREQV